MSKLTLPRLIEFYRDPEYFRRMAQIGVPVALQNLALSGLNMIGVVIVGQLGEVAVASVGLAGQVFFLLNLLIFGVTSGAAMFTAQLWGKRDLLNLRKVLGLCLTLSLAAALLFLLLSELIPTQILSIYSRDARVVVLGSAYLRIYAGTFIFYAITTAYASVLRSMGVVKLPVAVMIASLVFNLALSYGLVFGRLGLPEMGVYGAAVAALIARLFECLVIVMVIYLTRSPLAISLRELTRFDLPFARRVLKSVAPVMLNELLWSFAITTYYAAYARISTEALAAVNISSTIDNLTMVGFFGLSHATAVLVGQQIGAGEPRSAFRYAARSLGLSMGGALFMGGLLLLLRAPVLSLYKVSPQVIADASRVLIVVSFLLWMRVSNVVLILSAFRSGGDTRFALFLDGFIIWLVGVPAVLIGAFVFHLPIYWVYLLTWSEEFTKWALGLWRFFSRKWIHDLTQTVAAEPALTLGE